MTKRSNKKNNCNIGSKTSYSFEKLKQNILLAKLIFEKRRELHSIENFSKRTYLCLFGAYCLIWFWMQLYLFSKVMFETNWKKFWDS